jgi:hypothetical protein
MNHTNQPAKPASRWLTRLLLLAGLGVLLVGAPQARAANLDAALLKAAPDILSYLKDKDYNNVGVLPFLVQKGTRQASFLSSPLSAALPARLENALIMCQESNEHKAVGIIRDAAGAASRAKVGAYMHSPVAFSKLFNAKYELAWGDKKVKPDVFLTGVVINDGDRSETKIKVQAFTAKSREDGKLKLSPVTKPILVKTDRSLLRDLGYTYALSRSVLKRGMTAKRRDEVALDQVNRQEQGQRKQTPEQSNQATPININGIGFKIYYDGVAQTLQPLSESSDGAKSPLYQVGPMQAGARITMSLTRLADDDQMLGVLLKVNGQNTFRPEGDEGAYPRKWLYPAERKGYEDVFEGIYTGVDGKNLLPFRVLTAEESVKAAKEIGDRAGWIDIEVYASGETPNTADGEEMKISTRGMSRPKVKPKTLRELQTTMRKANNVRPKKGVVAKRGPGGLLLYDMEPVEGGYVEISDKLPNPVRLGGISIRYYDGKGGDDDEKKLTIDE